MDSKTKGMVMAGMMAGALLLAILSVFGGSWLSPDDADDDVDFTVTLSGQEASSEGISMEIDYSELCDDLDDDDFCSAATAGTVGTIGLWIAIICAALSLAMMVLPMAGIDALDAIPEMVSKIVPWAAGGLMLVTTLLWLILMPELDDTSVGMTFYMSMLGGLLGLAAPAMGMLVAADE
ncbi:hypothetical protein N9V58_01055 [Candidatus Poseidoniales archaeon]|nr:hypothetical protein [Candidatus Poseidoniales archaeon]MDB2348367.1 hypothetical protein [Candidatus Poseidoniales archaeon]